MNRRPRTRALCVFALGAAVCSTLQAAEPPDYNPSWYLLPQINTLEADSDWAVDSNQIGGGLKLGKALTESFDIQFGGSFASEKEEDRKYSQTLFGADALWLFTRRSFRPFLLAGFGAERDKLSGNMLTGTSKNAPYFNAGAGFQWLWSDRVFMQADARYVHGFLNSNTWGRDTNGNWLLSLGVGFHFGDTPAAAAPAKPAPAAATPAPSAAASPAPAPKPAAEKVTLTADALFDYNQASLRQEGQAKLSEFATKAKQLAIEVIVAVGHTDRLGSDQYNQPLSERRAAAVKEYLIAMGIDPNRIYTEGKGKTMPVSDCKGLGKASGQNAKLVDCLQPDRRVDIEVIGTRQP